MDTRRGAAAAEYWELVRRLGGSALIALLIGLVFTPISRVLFSDELRSEVIIQAIPFVTYFAAIILLFVLVVALTAKWLHLSIPFRTHRAVEFTTIAGILVGIVALFQPWHQRPYRYAFNVLLFATLGFILMEPRNPPRGSGRRRPAQVWSEGDVGRSHHGCSPGHPDLRQPGDLPRPSEPYGSAAGTPCARSRSGRWSSRLSVATASSSCHRYWSTARFQAWPPSSWSGNSPPPSLRFRPPPRLDLSPQT